MKNDQRGMTLIVKTATRILCGLIFVYGVFIVLDGHRAPGGGFAGGLIIALSFIQLVLSFGREPALVKSDIKRSLYLSVAGIILFLLFAGLENMRPGILGDGSEAIFDIAVALLVSAGILVVFLSLILSCEPKEER